MKRQMAALLIIFLIIILSSFFFYQQERKTYLELVPNRSTYNSAPTGCKAFYLLLKEMGFETARWQLPMNRLDSSSAKETLLVMIDPRIIAGSSCHGGVCSLSSEVETLLSWVREGGHLFIIDGSENGLHSDNEVLKALDIEIVKTQDIWDAEERVLFPVLPTAYARKVKAIKIRGDAHLTESITDEGIVHLGDENGPVLVSRNLGKGQITILTAPYVASNRGIDKGDNVILLTNVIAKDGNGREVLFDEYHHGYDSSLSIFGYYRGTPVAWVSLQILLTACVLFYSLSRRFGKPQPLKQEETRSILEYVKSMASLHYKAGLQASVLKNIYLRYKNAWIKRFGLSPGMELEKLCSLISARANLDQERFFRTIQKCERVSDSAIRVDKGEFLNLVKDLEIYRRKIYGQY